MNGAILLVARNGLHLTKKAVVSAVTQTIPCDVLVVDNASSDGTRDWLKTKPIGGVYLAHQHSLSACWNIGLRTLFALGYEQVLVCNNDIVLRPDTWQSLAALQLPFVSAVSVDSVDRMGVTGDRVLSAEDSRPHPDFSCFMIHKYVTDRVGWFDESYYPAYCEDCDYHVRMHRAGISAVCVDLPFLHVGAQTVSIADAGEAARIRRGADQNREKFRLKYGCLPGTPEYQDLFKV